MHLKLTILITQFAFLSFLSAQKIDTISITSKNLQLQRITDCASQYLVFNKSSESAPAKGMYLVNIKISKKLYNNSPSIFIDQQWDQDTVIHSANTIFSGNDLTTLLHQYYWKRKGYATKFNFEDKTVSFEGSVSDSIKIKVQREFDESLTSFSLNWHSDLFVFSLLPLKLNTVFKINFYDPGFGKPKEVLYTVLGKESLKTSSGKQIKCWLLETRPNAKSYQKFWISQTTFEVIKEEDFFNNSYRFKLKIEAPLM